MTGGLLLTGGASRRFGSPKAALLVDGERLADRGARLLGEVCDVVVEVGPGYSSLAVAREEPAGTGPLAALVAGADALEASAYLVLAVDLPFMERALLEYLRDHPSPASVVPRVGGVAQPLCARYSTGAVQVARSLLDDGARAMNALLDAVPVTWINEAECGRVASAEVLADVDTRADAVERGLELPR